MSGFNFFFILNFSFNKLTRQTLQKNLLDNFPFNCFLRILDKKWRELLADQYMNKLYIYISTISVNQSVKAFTHHFHSNRSMTNKKQIFLQCLSSLILVSHAKICDDSMLLILFKEKIVTDKLSSFMVVLCPDSIFSSSLTSVLTS
jgi:hypothetical protein